MNISPTVGRIVNFYHSDPSNNDAAISICPAIITSINTDGSIALTVFLLDNILYVKNAIQGDTEGKWDWMPFQKDQQARLAPIAPTPEVASVNPAESSTEVEPSTTA